jgi:hypothetical protein
MLKDKMFISHDGIVLFLAQKDLKFALSITFSLKVTKYDNDTQHKGLLWHSA